MSVKGQLAINGGEPVIKEPLPGGAAARSLIDEREVEAVAKVIRSGNLFRFSDHENSECTLFEREACEYLGVRYGLLVNSGTNALITALIGLGVGPGDEVIVPGYTFISTAAAVVAVGAVPIIAEIDDSLGLDPEDVAKKLTPFTRCILPVHMQGVPARLNDLRKIADDNDLFMVEDCCQAIGARYFDKVTGTIGHVGAWSFNYFKVITCGEGGFVFTDDYIAYERACFNAEPALPMWMKQYATEPPKWQTEPFSNLGLRSNEINAAMMRVQLSKIEIALNRCRAVKRAVRENLESPKHYVVQHQDDPDGDCGISMALVVESQSVAHEFAKALRAEGLGTGTAHNDGFPDRHIYRYWDSILQKRAHHPGMSPWTHPYYKGKVDYHPDMCPRTLDILNRTLRFGFNVNMTPEHGELIAQAINKVDAGL
jgi:8-amino-3,8-dideoxy-alpha-D-manno-octulosonate transaminase